MNVKHKFVSTIVTDPAATAAGEVTPNNWNDTHVITGTASALAGYDGSGNSQDVIIGSGLTLSGNILTSSGGSGGITRSINSISANANLGSATSTDYVYFCTGTITATLPTAVGNTNRYTVANQGSGTITLASAGGGINGNQPLTQQYMSYDLISDGINWNIV